MDVEHFRAGEFDWKVRRDFRTALDTLCESVDDPGRIEGSVPIKASVARAVWRMTLGGRTVYVKRYHIRGWFEKLKYRVVPSRAEAEWRAALALADAGIDVVDPLAVGMAFRGPWLADAFFVAEEKPGVTYSELLGDLRRRGESLTALLEATVALHDALQEAGIFHPDLHGGNILGRLVDGTPKLALVDLHSIRFPRIAPRRARPRMRGKLAHALSHDLRADEFERVLPMLAPGAEEALRRRVARVERVRLRSRSRRCVLPSTRFARERTAGWKIWRRREVSRDALFELISESPHLPHRIATLEVDGERREVSVWRRSVHGWTSVWKGLHALDVRNIPTWRAYACMHRRCLGVLRDAVLVVEYLPEASSLESEDSAFRDTELQQVALDTAARLHRAGLSAGAHDLYALRRANRWRVLRAAPRGVIPDRPISEARAEREFDALRALTSSNQAVAASR